MPKIGASKVFAGAAMGIACTCALVLAIGGVCGLYRGILTGAWAFPDWTGQILYLAAWSGAVIGANRLLLLGDLGQRRIAAGLALWIGSTFTLIPGLFLLTMSFPSVRERLTSGPNANPLWAQILQHVLIMGVGLAILHQSRAELFGADVLARFKTGFQEIFLPDPGAALHIYRVELPFKLDELDRRLEGIRPPRPNPAAIVAALSNDRKKVFARRKGESVFFFFPGIVLIPLRLRIQETPQGLVLSGKSTATFFGMQYTLQVWLGCLGGLGLLLATCGASTSEARLILAWISNVLLVYAVLMYRFLKSTVLRQEAIATQLLRDDWGAVITSTPRRQFWPWF